MTESFKRAGVILYTEEDDGEIYFCLAYDARRKCYSDFGGGREITDGVQETVFETASRELKEESAGIFQFTPEEISARYTGAIYNDKSITFFVKIKTGCFFEEINTWFLMEKEKYKELLATETQKYNLFLEDSGSYSPPDFQIKKKTFEDEIENINFYLETDFIRWVSVCQFSEMMSVGKTGSSNLIGGLKHTFRHVTKTCYGENPSSASILRIISNRSRISFSLVG